MSLAAMEIGLDVLAVTVVALEGGGWRRSPIYYRIGVSQELTPTPSRGAGVIQTVGRVHSHWSSVAPITLLHGTPRAVGDWRRSKCHSGGCGLGPTLFGCPRLERFLLPARRTPAQPGRGRGLYR